MCIFFTDEFPVDSNISISLFGNSISRSFVDSGNTDLDIGDHDETSLPEYS
jgi:hypothetical protein